MKVINHYPNPLPMILMIIGGGLIIFAEELVMGINWVMTLF